MSLSLQSQMAINLIRRSRMKIAKKNSRKRATVHSNDPHFGCSSYHTLAQICIVHRYGHSRAERRMKKNPNIHSTAEIYKRENGLLPRLDASTADANSLCEPKKDGHGINFGRSMCILNVITCRVSNECPPIPTTLRARLFRHICTKCMRRCKRQSDFLIDASSMADDKRVLDKFGRHDIAKIWMYQCLNRRVC